jgi:hypothetical protein
LPRYFKETFILNILIFFKEVTLKFSFTYRWPLFFLIATGPRVFSAEMTAKEQLLQMAGCFRVTFNYVEDGEHDKFYAPVLEKSDVTSEDPLTFTRTLIIEGEEELHWSDTWTEVEGGIWRQKVIGPFGDFRYECEGLFVGNQWSCQAPRSAKPRRDADRPYDYLNRQNTLQINSQRWVHVQNNQKLTADGSLYSVEVGWNRYDRRPSEECEAAISELRK